jgi:hypothetical protein
MIKRIPTKRRNTSAMVFVLIASAMVLGWLVSRV